MYENLGCLYLCAQCVCLLPWRPEEVFILLELKIKPVVAARQMLETKTVFSMPEQPVHLTTKSSLLSPDSSIVHLPTCLPICLFIYVLIYLCSCLFACWLYIDEYNTCVYVWRSEYNLEKLVLSFHNVIYGDQAQSQVWQQILLKDRANVG